MLPTKGHPRLTRTELENQDLNTNNENRSNRLLRYYEVIRQKTENGDPKVIGLHGFH